VAPPTTVQKHTKNEGRQTQREQSNAVAGAVGGRNLSSKLCAVLCFTRSPPLFRFQKGSLSAEIKKARYHYIVLIE